ncbi:hypothetical protein KR032_007227 [Drosophila birchii]|nr:hypothetical protein KR032_007227 [Drosophila birchii]
MDAESSTSLAATNRSARKCDAILQPETSHSPDPAQVQTTAPQAARSPKVSRIMVPGVVSYSAFCSELDALIGNNYSIKALNSGDCAIQCNSSDAYKPEDRPFRMVMRNILHEVPSEDIIECLQAEGHCVIRIYTPRNKATQLPLNMRFVDIKKADNNKLLKNITAVCRHVVTWEKPRKQSGPVQCHKCQEYGHTKAYCTRHHNCRECGENHPTQECILGKDDPRCCFHCGESHAANFRGCRKYLQVAFKQNNHSKNIAAAESNTSPPTHLSPNVSKKSFASVVRRNQLTAQRSHHRSEMENTPPPTHSTANASLDAKLEQLELRRVARLSACARE